MFKIIPIALLALILAPACNWVNKVDPAIPNTPSPGQPCGPIDVICYDGAGKVDGCCGQYDTCGGAFPSVGCPADSCCDLGGDTGLMGAHQRRANYPKRTPYTAH